MIVIVDYRVGNIGSIVSMLNKIGVNSIVSNQESDIKKASKLILPGVGAFDKAMHELQNQKLVPILNEVVLQDKKPTLGICLGAQILGKSSEEGRLPGFGWIDMTVKRFDHAKLRVPHMGWSFIKPAKKSSLFCLNKEEDFRFYFAHSYYMSCKSEKDILATTLYGSEFVSAVQKGNITGVQFHPEKSHRFGFHLLKSFANAS